jgi:hypothetical protein
MEHFLKLEGKFNFGQYRKGQSIVSHGKNVNESFMGINYLSVATQDAKEIFEVIPERFRAGFHLVLMNINSFIPPHIDNNIKSTINFYIKPDNCKTQFYKFIGEPNGDSNVYGLGILEQTEGFFANEGDAYLLDVTKPHAVWDMGDELIDTQMGIMDAYEDAKADMSPDLSKKRSDFPSGYKDTNRIAICLQSSKYSFGDVKQMLEEVGAIEGVAA